MSKFGKGNLLQECARMTRHMRSSRITQSGIDDGTRAFNQIRLEGRNKTNIHRYKSGGTYDWRY